MKKLLVLGGAEKSLPMVRYAKSKGHAVVLCDQDPNSPCRKLAEAFIEISTVDHLSIADAARAYCVDGVVSFGSDINAVSAARIAAALDLPGNPPRSVLTMVRKDLFRAFLSEYGFEAPRAASFASINEASAFAGSIKAPVILKPVDGAGSAGVYRIQDRSSLASAFRGALDASREKRVLIEEFVERSHPHMIGGDVFVVDGKVRFWGLMNSHRSCESAPFLPTGTSFPLVMEDDRQQAVRRTIKQLVTALGIRYGGINVELMFDQSGRLYVIELAPRNGGNHIPELLRTATGVDMVAALVDCSLGEPVDLTPRVKSRFVANYMLHSERAGQFKDVTLDKAVWPFVMEKILTVVPGDGVRAFQRATDAVGTLYLRFQSAQEQQAILSRISELVTVDVVPG